MNLSDGFDNEMESLEALDEEAQRQDVDTAASTSEAAATGLAYSPPDEAPIHFGRADDAVAAGARVPNEELLEDVLVALADNPATSEFDVRARVHDDVVTVRGKVPTPADAEEVLSTVLAVSGADNVEDDLEVDQYG